MKGIVFSEFLELVEDKFGLETVEQIIKECDLATGGSYTSIGTYDHKEMFEMVGVLSDIQNIPVQQLLEIYGEHFFTILAKGYPQFLEKNDLFSFLNSIDNYIHPEVLKLYPDAELPKFDAAMNNDKTEMMLVYRSSRKMSSFAIGLLKGAATFYNQETNISKIKEENNGEIVTIKITLV
ncbi:heme NO-binding domain-containing protein [Crocinitomix algicola]|uniref:heme NO-binding domain-containing protein n=1 Tax=Crocinitomix algicola TaxID=1740263 RepID=UPI000831612A|nr:heme NO-binding domain-containing protein [Crocinitomix algicola]